jgi:DNA-binding transcriptional LysR family regulator
MDFRIRQLQCFLTLAEKLNYGQAARAQFMSQPTLSFQIKSLEECFGARLFDRSHRGVTLTHAGHQLAHSARLILAEVESARRQIASISTQMPLRVCCSQVGQIEALPRVVRYLSESHPDVHLDIQYTLPEERVRALVEGKLDVLMLVAPVQAAGVTFQLLRKESSIAILPDIPRYRGKRSISICELASNKLLVASEQECSYAKHFILDVLERFHLSPEIVESPINLSFRLAMVAAGQGVCIGSEALLRLKYPGVLFIPFEEALPRRWLGVAWRTHDTSEHLKIFNDALVRIAKRGSEEPVIEELPVFVSPAARKEYRAKAS